MNLYQKIVQTIFNYTVGVAMVSGRLPVLIIYIVGLITTLGLTGYGTYKLFQFIAHLF